ncbi:MAG: metalloregulator ArsR/SmtB family transcription factor [Candidatus Izemoplasmatales bacterium]
MNSQLSQLFHALSDETRRKIIENIALGDCCSCTLINQVHIAQPTLSYHLKILSESGLTTAEKRGVWRAHHLNRDEIDQMISYLHNLKDSIVSHD